MDSCLADIYNQAIYRAVVLAVHGAEDGQKTLRAVLAPKSLLPEVEKGWYMQGGNKARSFIHLLRRKELIYFCLPLSEDNDHDHLPLQDYCLRFNLNAPLKLDNNADIHLRGKYMLILVRNPCSNSENQSTRGDCHAKVPIHIAEPLQGITGPNTEYSPEIKPHPENGVSSI